MRYLYKDGGGLWRPSAAVPNSRPEDGWAWPFQPPSRPNTCILAVIRAWHALEHSHKQAWRGLATKLRRPPHEGLLERRSYCPRPRFCTQWASYDRHEKLQRARCPRAHARGARPRGIASRPSSASRAGSGRGVTQNQAKNAPFRPSDLYINLRCLGRWRQHRDVRAYT